MAAVKTIEELVAWQLSVQLRDLVYTMTGRGKAVTDRKFVEQIRDSSASVPRNLAEGFGRYYPRENARFVRIAKGSLSESRTHLLHGRTEKYWSEDQFDQAWTLSRRAMGATVGWLRYLESCDGQIPETPAGPDPT